MGKVKKRTLCHETVTIEEGQFIMVKGWVHRRRDHGGLIFIDIRDRSGILQCVFSPLKEEAFTLAHKLKSEYVIEVSGILAKRPESTENPDLYTGLVELEVEEIVLLSTSNTLPFSISDEQEVAEDIRLKYRYLDLRRSSMQKSLILRHQVSRAVREYLDDEGFLEIETPMLTRSTPEGARDYLIPSRVLKGHFFALPQSPQLFKQLLMVAGMERYYQIVRCFRDEDLRADRQPEFTQIDIEVSFTDEEEMIQLNEGLLRHIFRRLGRSQPKEFLRLSYDESMDLYGTDRPDLRFSFVIQDFTSLFAKSSFKVFGDVIKTGGSVRGIKVDGGASFNRSQLDSLTDFTKNLGAKGLIWMLLKEEGFYSPIQRFLLEEELLALQEMTGATPGDLLLLVADEKRVVQSVLGALRLEVAQRLKAIPSDEGQFLWVTDFPLFEVGDDGSLTSSHHPFTAPKEEDLPLLETHPQKVRSKAYDLVYNGEEIGGGSIRIIHPLIQEKIFEVLGLTKEEGRDKFGFLLSSFQYGAPPHGGIAYGLDRLVMILAGKKNIRDVIAFPKTQRSTCLMTGAPTLVSPSQLRELGIMLEK